MKLEMKHLENFGIYLIDEQGVVAECIYEIIYTIKRLTSVGKQKCVKEFKISKKEFEQRHFQLDGNKILSIENYFLGERNCKLLSINIRKESPACVGKKLIDKLIEVAKENKCKEIYSDLPNEESETNYNLFLSLGFKLEKRGEEKVAVLDLTKTKDNDDKAKN